LTTTSPHHLHRAGGATINNTTTPFILILETQITITIDHGPNPLVVCLFFGKKVLSKMVKPESSSRKNVKEFEVVMVKILL
jgi:hypothetical protein